MEKLQDYLTLEGWRRDLEQTKTDFSDLSILTKRALGKSYYGLPKFGGEMTSSEFKDFCFDSKALWFSNEREYELHRATNYWPIGPCKIGLGKNARREDDSIFFDNSNWPKELKPDFNPNLNEMIELPPGFLSKVCSDSKIGEVYSSLR